MDTNALYLEADEDITSAIDKLRKAPPGPVSIVVPKRSTLLQSVINLKLLKKAADDAGRHLVLVTGDKTATELASRVGLPVAATLGGKAVLTTADLPVANETEDVIDGAETETEAVPAEAAALAQATPVVRPAKSAEAKTGRAAKFQSREVEDNEADTGTALERGDATITPETTAAEAAMASETAAKPDKGAKLPNYNRLQRRLLWVTLVVILVIGYFVGMYFLSTAKVTLYAAANQTNVSAHFTVAASGTSDLSKGLIAGRRLTSTKTLTGSFQATGTKDAGTKASGTLTVTNACYNPGTMVSGTTFSSGGLNFVSTSSVDIPDANFSHGSCAVTKATIPVVASTNGDNYNLGPADYTASGIPSSGSTYVKFQGGQMSGGTTKTVKVVQQSDIDKAKAALLDQDKDGSMKSLAGTVPSGFTALPASLTQNSDPGTSDPAVGEEATSANLTLQVTYLELAVNSHDYQAFVVAAEQKQVGAGNQIYDNGLKTAQLSPQTPAADGSQDFDLVATAYSGPKLDAAQIAGQLAGKRYGVAADTASGLPGVHSADVTIWPAWQGSMPHIKSHIKITISVAKS